jgi:hypothetical protein
MPLIFTRNLADRDAIRQIRSLLHGNKPDATKIETSKVAKKAPRNISPLRDICTSAVAGKLLPYYMSI